jgi:hypothetical protein
VVDLGCTERVYKDTVVLAMLIIENLDNENINCSFLVAHEMVAIACNPNVAIRKRWSQHQLNKVFDYVSLADQVRDIYGATPVETMHAFRRGMIEVVTFLILDNVPPSK